MITIYYMSYCHILAVMTVSHRMLIFRCLQYMNKIYEICVFLFLSLKYLLFECSLKKRNILNYPFPQVRKVFFAFLLLILWLMNVLLINQNPISNPCFPFSSLSKTFFVTCSSNGHIY